MAAIAGHECCALPCKMWLRDVPPRSCVFINHKLPTKLASQAYHARCQGRQLNGQMTTHFELQWSSCAKSRPLASTDCSTVMCQVEAVKLFVLKTINLATLVYQLFVIQTNANTAQQYLHIPNYADYLTVCLLTPTCTLETSAIGLLLPHACILRVSQYLVLS